MKLTPLIIAASTLILVGAGCVNIRKTAGPETAPAPASAPTVTNVPVKVEESENKESMPKAETTPKEETTTEPATSTEKTGAGAEASANVTVEIPATVTVTITDTGFLPNDVTVKVNGTVTFVNTANTTQWPASAPHPAHTNLPGFDSQGIDPGQSWTYQFTKVGNWAYHDHVAPSHFGVVRVKD